MLRFLVFCFGLFVSILSYGRYLTFVTTDNRPIADVHCVGYLDNGDSIASWVSNEKGIIDTGTLKPDHILASHTDFSDKIIFCDKLKAENDVITLSSAVELKEVVVRAADMEEFATHTSYRLSQKDMSRYANVLQSLNLIPNLTVLSNGTVFFEGDSNIKILIDGVDATMQEVQTLSKEDIAKVDVYQTPPLRFMAQGVSAVIDIKLKSKIYGGNGALDVTQAFRPLKGANSAALYYNYAQSRFSVLYSNENTHYKKYRQTEELEYEFGEEHYNKKKRGLDSKNHFDDNNLTFSYQINKPQNFLYNIKAGMAFNQSGGTSLQEVTTPDQSFYATNRLYTDYTKYIIGNYFEKNLGERIGTLLANINYQRFSTSYNSAYREFTDLLPDINNVQSDYKTHLDAIFSEVQYQLPYKKLGQFSIVAFGNYKHSKYVDTINPFFQTSGMLGGSAEWMGMKGSVRWWLTLGMNWYHTASSSLVNSNDLIIPTPNINITWRPSGNTYFTFAYSYSGDKPSIAQLSESDQWLDTKLVYHGNSTLKPSKEHDASIRFGWNMKYLNFSIRNGYNSTSGKICDMYTATDRYMLQTLVNLSVYRQWSSQIDLSVLPLGNSKLVFWNRIILADLKGKNREYSWKGYRFQWMSDLALNLQNWSVDLFYQYPGKIAEGQLERPRAQCWSATVLYRPMTNLSFGLEWFMPFGNGFKESEHTINNAPVYASTEYMIMDRNNMLSIKLSYNFSFGRNKNRATPQYDNFDNDSGLLHKR